MPPEDPQPLSAILRDVAGGDARRVCVDDLMERFGGSAMGALLLLFGLACLLPLPPGGTTLFGAPLLLLAPQLAFGRHAPWLPAKLRRRSISLEDVRKGLPKVLKWLERMEAVSRPRLTWLFAPAGVRMIGAVCTVLAFILILPIPLGNFLPAIAVSLLALSLVQRDGVLALAGYAVAAVGIGVVALTFGAISRLAHHVIMIMLGA